MQSLLFFEIIILIGDKKLFILWERESKVDTIVAKEYYLR